MTTALTKIAEALDLLADEADAAPVATEKVAEAFVAPALPDFAEYYRVQTGLELPDSVTKKFAEAPDPELLEVFRALSKTASAPTSMGEASDAPVGTPFEPSNRNEAVKLAYDQFESMLFEGDR